MESTHQTLAGAGEPCSVVRVRNLQSTVSSASDAWGRQDRPQPALVSVEASFRQRFLASAAADAVAADTVHYGVLSKEILKYLQERTAAAAATASSSSEGGDVAAAAAAAVEPGLRATVEGMWTRLVGCNLSGERKTKEDTLLKPERLRHLVISVRVPKGTLLGDGVSLTATAAFEEGGAMGRAALALRTHGLRVPTLIGVNGNERTAKQVVVASVEIDRYPSSRDEYVPIEAIITQRMTDSSFETLEALALVLARAVKEWLAAHSERPTGGGGWKLTVTLEKPVAVPFADASCVELVAYTDEI
ncbi:hypothetical protein N3K66_001357 [Trichothecium roseum]|uniref:Uncharacterized protein n=1 Tax=Trichothecium roseum TaxID=47278 RepID=A0ACC0VFE0_9HYPO|nr:hypothetical protein N3K66_001357 [Trichothecium roseum]